jgi:hypothetical protein
LTKRTCRKSWEDEIFGQSARMALYFFFALFPMLLLLLVLLGKTVGGASEWRDALLEFFKQVLPPDASALITQTIEQLNARAVFGTGAILAAVYASWGALNGTWAMMTGLNKAYEVEEKRPWWRVLYDNAHSRLPVRYRLSNLVESRPVLKHVVLLTPHRIAGKGFTFFAFADREVLPVTIDEL